MNDAAEAKVTNTAVKSMKIKTPNNEQIARFHLGEINQKIVLGKWLAMKPKLLMLDEPTGELTLGQKGNFTNLWKSWRVREWLSCLFPAR